MRATFGHLLKKELSVKINKEAFLIYVNHDRF